MNKNQIDKDLNKLKTWLASENLEYAKFEKHFEQYNDSSKLNFLLEHINWLKRIISYVESARDNFNE